MSESVGWRHGVIVIVIVVILFIMMIAIATLTITLMIITSSGAVGHVYALSPSHWQLS